MNRASKWLSIVTLGICLFSVPKAIAQGYDNYDYSYNDNANNTTATYQDFYDGLAPYGQWINDSRYGYVWLPNVGRDFRPYYSNGYWAMTEYGNTWVSNYPWGWAPFHYGRWTYDNYYGWLWIPDTQWGPAWVSWRCNNDYYGWAPMGPGLNINISLGAIPIDWWIFLSPNYLYDHSFHRYYNGYGNNVNIYNQTVYINNIYVDNRSHQSYICGPKGDDYYRHTGHRTPVYTINNNNRPGSGGSIQGNRLNLYRPAINNPGNATAAPQKFVPAQQAVASRPQPLSSNGGRPTGRDHVLQQTPVQQNVNRAQPIQNQQVQQQRVQQNQQLEQQRQQVQMQQQQRVQQDQQMQQQAQQRQQQMQIQQQQAQQRQQQMQQQQKAQQDQQRQQQMQIQQQQAQQRQQQMQMQQQQAQQRQQQMQMQQQQAQQRQQQMQMQQQQAQQRQQQRQQQMQQQQARPQEQREEGRR